MEQSSMRRKASKVPWAIQTYTETSNLRHGIRGKQLFINFYIYIVYWRIVMIYLVVAEELSVIK